MTEEQFWAKINTGSSDECWPWTGALHSSGYGRYGDTKYAHRAVLAAKLGREIAAGMLALHKCDNPPCCNPDHLFEGTPGDNSRDMAAKGRVRGGMPKGYNQYTIHLRSAITGVH